MATYSLLIPILIFSLTAGAAESDSASLFRQLEEQVKAIRDDTEIRNKAIEKGREKALFCANCHGTDGNSVKPKVPNLAAQNPVYLLSQIINFASGKRKDYTTVMQQLSRNMTDEEKIALAVYYASVPLKPNRVYIPEEDYTFGKYVYIANCVNCHGENGAGKKEFARIGGQQYEYLKQVLTRFRDADENRKSAIMTSVVKSYDDKELSAIAGYISKLKP